MNIGDEAMSFLKLCMEEILKNLLNAIKAEDWFEDFRYLLDASHSGKDRVPYKHKKDFRYIITNHGEQQICA